MEAIIPDEILDQFANMDPGKEGGAEMPDGDRESYQQNLQGLNDAINWFVKTADEQAKNMGYPGTGKVPPEKLGRLLSIVAERNLTDVIIQKTPEVAAVSIFAGILGVNYMHYRKEKLRGPSYPQDERNKAQAKNSEGNE